jgi:hypothetical protein
MTEAIQFGTKTIVFWLEYSDRKSLGITVMPDLEVRVTAPMSASLDKIKEKVKKRAGWIIRQQNFFRSFQPKTTERKYISGETHLYLGRQYRLKVVIVPFREGAEKVRLSGAFLEVYSVAPERVPLILNDWYIEKAKEKIILMAKQLADSFAVRNHLTNVAFQFSFRYMPTRWGSCTRGGKIILNPELIRAPKGCIEYVIIHELCHLVHHNHTQKFLDLQTREMKDWEKWKMKLERLLA